MVDESAGMPQKRRLQFSLRSVLIAPLALYAVLCLIGGVSGLVRYTGMFSSLPPGEVLLGQLSLILSGTVWIVSCTAFIGRRWILAVSTLVIGILTSIGTSLYFN